MLLGDETITSPPPTHAQLNLQLSAGSGSFSASSCFFSSRSSTSSAAQTLRSQRLFLIISVVGVFVFAAFGFFSAGVARILPPPSSSSSSSTSIGAAADLPFSVTVSGISSSPTCAEAVVILRRPRLLQPQPSPPSYLTAASPAAPSWLRQWLLQPGHRGSSSRGFFDHHSSPTGGFFLPPQRLPLQPPPQPQASPRPRLFLHVGAFSAILRRCNSAAPRIVWSDTLSPPRPDKPRIIHRHPRHRHLQPHHGCPFITLLQPHHRSSPPAAPPRLLQPVVLSGCKVELSGSGSPLPLGRIVRSHLWLLSQHRSPSSSTAVIHCVGRS